MVAGLPAGRGLVASFYATGHSSLGTPSARYVSELMRLFQVQPGVEGIMVYTMQAPDGPCEAKGPGPLWSGDKGCIVADVFSSY